MLYPSQYDIKTYIPGIPFSNPDFAIESNLSFNSSCAITIVQKAVKRRVRICFLRIDGWFYKQH